MKKNTINILIGVGALAVIGGFIFSQKKPKKSGSNNADGSGDCGCNNASGDVEPDPYMMLEVNQKDFPNFTGGDQMVLAEKNAPFGQYFHDPVGIVVSSKPFVRRNRGTYKSRI
jgi:hypothetical protein